jgi:hypoxanthine phosphoribosyltransferase
VTPNDPAPQKILFSAEQIGARVKELGARINADYGGRPILLLGVLKGSFIFMADLARAIASPVTVEFLGVQSYGNATLSSGVVRITMDLTRSVENEDVLIVEDIVDTGLTSRFLMEYIAARKPRSVKLCTLLHKPSRTVKPVEIDYLGFTVDDVFVVGYGLDHAQAYRNLPDLRVVA